MMSRKRFLELFPLAHNDTVKRNVLEEVVGVRKVREGSNDDPKSKAIPAKRSGQGSVLEERFIKLWNEMGGPPLEREYRFHKTRKWRFDYCYLAPAHRIAIELEGGIYQMGRHQRAYGFQNDAFKYFEATLLGYTVFRLTSKMIDEDTLRRIITHISH